MGRQVKRRLCPEAIADLKYFAEFYNRAYSVNGERKKPVFTLKGIKKNWIEKIKELPE